MNTQDENLDAVQSHGFDPFPEPQTIPWGWDVNGLVWDEEGGDALRHTNGQADAYTRNAPPLTH